MDINVLLTPKELVLSSKKGECVAIVIDVLRASTTICIALSNGAQAILPSSTVQEAISNSLLIPKNKRFLSGERNGVKQPGFDAGNSPLEYTFESVKDKIISFTTSNGTYALELVSSADCIYLGSFLNLQAVAEHITSHHNGDNLDITIICAGSGGNFCIEDATCAGGFVQYLHKNHPDAILTDSAIVSEILFSTYQYNLHKFLSNTTHGIDLQNIGFADDIICAADLNSLDVVPLFDGNTIVLAH